MKKHKISLHILMTFVLGLSIFFMSVPQSHAQTDQDWSVPVNLSFSGAAINPVMVIDLSGTIHAIWVDDIDGYKYSQSVDGQTWTQPQSVKFPFSSDQPPVLLAGKDGSIRLFWISRESVLFYGQTTPVDFPNPGNWISTFPLASAVLNFDVIMDSNGSLHLAYIRKATSIDSPAGVYYRNINASGGGWTEVVNLYVSEYFRSAEQSEGYIRVASSNSLMNQSIYVTWDSRAQKRVYMATSTNSGLNWGGAKQIKGPEDTGGIDSPFNLSVAASDKNVLLMWQVGEPGSSKCTLYSQWSEDNGNNWGDVIAVFGGRSECPLGAKFITQNKDHMVALLSGEVAPVLIAWNGERWSDAQTQTQLPSFSNPVTYDAILFGCRFDLIDKDRLYVIGCDLGSGGDVWFLSRLLEPVEDWFSPSANWGEPTVLSVKSENPERISYFYATPDNAGNIHAVWAQSPVVLGSESNIEYARWNGQEWTTPEAVITSLSGTPVQLLLTTDTLERLLLSWIDSYNGDLLFSWANLEKANLASEWVEMSGLPSPSQLINSSDVVVDGSGRIIYVYVVPINEERGIYIVQSVDNGKSWSTPTRAFDAVSASWERIEQVRISLDSNGTLHLIFVRGTVRDGQPVGLYYSRSVDGGATWSDVQIISEGEIQWADIVSYDDKTIHVVWQEYDRLVYANISQVSQDGGMTWAKQNNVTGVNESATQVSLASDGHGLLHFIQLVNKDSAEAYNQKGLVLQDWKWDGAGWNLELTKDVLIKGENINYSLSAGITSTDYLGVFLPVEYTVPVDGIKSEILTFSRYLADDGNGQQSQVSIVPTPIVQSNDIVVPTVQPTSTPDSSVLYDDNLSTSPLQRNIAGIILIGVGIMVTVFLLVWRRSTKSGK